MKKHKIFKAIKDNDYKIIEEILKTGLNIDDIWDNHEQNPLHVAILNENIQIVKLFLDYGVDIENKVRSFGGYYKNLTPFQVAARIGNTEIAKMLIERGAEIFKKGQYGRNSLHLACIGGSTWLVKYLIKNGLDVNTADDSKYLPIHMAANNCNHEVVKVLLEAGSPINPQNEYGSTPLHLVAKTLAYKEIPEDHKKTIEILVQNGANLYIKNEWGKIPAEEALHILTQYFMGKLAAEQKGDPIEEWLSKAADFFRGMGFFEKYKGLPKKEFIKKINELVKDSYWLFSPNDHDADLPLVVLDKDRVYNCPMIGDAHFDFGIYEKDKRYKEFVENLNPIGRGIVKFMDIKEKWRSKEGPIEVSFKYKGKTLTIIQDYFGEYFDYSFINQISKIIKDTGYFFDLYHPSDMVAWGGFVMLLNNEEREKLIKERGWKLYSEDNFEKVRAELEEIYYDRLCEEWFEDFFSFKDEGKYEQAFAIIEKILKYRDEWEYWHHGGQVLLLLDKNEETKKYLNKAIELIVDHIKKYGEHGQATYELARSYALLNNKNKTLETLRRAIELVPRYKNEAKDEEDFKNFKKDRDFISLID